MFKCGKCAKSSEPGEKMSREIVEVRNVSYFDKDGDLIGKGWEIVKEINICPRCKGG